ncbi:hypothetical protein B0A50_07246 [Salinomyces thailandicus]|uniref:Telomere length regulation protein conserved domain-containing protein n=1 Tax=Salinomyces thailandicus TaxID=706561 RepID=A0A4U0TM17_9PEZI|nr:hypothetical protein B0A50_07246 [Salinomyces thailandica]
MTVCKTPEEALRVLRSQPDIDTLVAALKQLSSNHGFDNAFALTWPGSLQEQIVNTIVTSIIPTFWSALNREDRRLLVACLRNITGVNAVIARLRSSPSESERNSGAKPGAVRDLLQVTRLLLQGDDVVLDLWSGLQSFGDEEIKRDLVWKEIVNLFGSGKIVGSIAQAEDAARQADQEVRTKSLWLASAGEYASWLGRNTASLAHEGNNDGNDEGTQARFIDAGKLLDKSLGLRQPAPFMKGFFGKSLEINNESDAKEWSKKIVQRVADTLPAFRRRQFVEQTLQWLASLLAEDEPHQQDDSQRKSISSGAVLIDCLIQSNPAMQNILSDLLADATQTASVSFLARQACISALSGAASETLQSLLERVMSAFNDALFIAHAPIVQQESLAQNLLLIAGHLYRQTPMAVLVAARSSSHMQGVSNRLDTSNARARWLGMVVATAISGLVDKEGQKMNFGIEDMKSEAALWYLGLTQVISEVGTLDGFRELILATPSKLTVRSKVTPDSRVETMPQLDGKPTFGPPRPPAPAQTEVIGEQVTELFDEGSVEDDDDDLKAYAKPDSDPEDSDEDATLVNRNRPRPPVYVRDLMRMLQDDQNADRFQLAIQHAAALIRRKSDFGSEVKDHAEELLSLLCNMQDPFDTDNFDELRLQAIIAVLLSNVQTLGGWLSRQVFVGEYSIAQRCLMLTALGLGGRELAGFKSEDDEFNPRLQNTEFPTKRLPPRLHAIYAGASTNTKRLDSAHKHVENQLIQPLALQAADQSTAHLNAVKIRTFFSRLSPSNRTKRKNPPNQLAQIFGRAFFFPLLGRYQQDLAAYSSGSLFASAPFMLVTFLRTLALLLHASGPATLALPQITAEFWDLLLSLRVLAAGDISVLQAVLFALLTLLEVHQDQPARLAQEVPKQLAETQQWVGVVFERFGGGDGVVGGSEEEKKVRTLAAGVLVRLGDVVKVEQERLFGRAVG